MTIPRRASATTQTLAQEPGAERSYYSVSEVAALLGVSRVSVWRWISSGDLPVTRLGHRTVRIKREDLQKILRQQRSSPAVKAPPAAAEQGADSAAHAVLFYDRDRFLLDEIVNFMLPQLAAAGRGVIVATPEHRAGIEMGLAAAGIDIGRAAAEQRLLTLDAAETLARFMTGLTPDPAKFRAVVDEVLRGSQGQARIFGEMVALLVAAGNPEAAVELEGLWSVVQAEYGFSLLCAYPMAGMSGAALAPRLLQACDAHSAVVPTESYSRLSSAGRLREVAVLQQKAASLEHEVGERRRAQEELQRALAAERAARADAEAALRTRDEFLSVASHELRTPITVLAAQAQLALRRLERNGQLEPERVASAMRTMGSQASKLSRLVSQLLDISRLDGGKLELDRQPIDLARMVDQVVATTMPLTERHTISLTSPESLECLVDGLRLEQVLSNVLDNAIKYSPMGGPIEVVLATPEAATIELTVRDFGLGIPEAKREHIFERFYQAHDNAYRTGLGLGLYVSRAIVEQHGGEMRAEAPADGGTRLVVRLPLVRATAGADDQTARLGSA